MIAKGNYEVHAIDLKSDRLESLLPEANFSFSYGDILRDDGWIEDSVKSSDVVVPLVAIASPLLYVKQPLKVFELDFEANLPIVRHCVKHNKHLVFPSTSEVYGMSPDLEFHPTRTNFVTGPVQMQRWIYSTCKQLMDRIIYAYGSADELNYTIFRPFNWFGPGLDSVETPREGGSRVVTNFIASILRGEEIILVNGGSQRRAFTYIDDGIDALEAIVDQRSNNSRQQIFNVGNPANDYSIAHLAETIRDLALEIPTLSERASKTKIVTQNESSFYGPGYQDVLSRNPNIDDSSRLLGWSPKVSLTEGLRRTLQYYADKIGRQDG